MQFEFAGTLPVADGRYLAREAGEDGAESVLVVETLGAPAPPGRRRRRPSEAEAAAEPPSLPLARATAVRAFLPFDDSAEAAAWLDAKLADEATIDALVAEGIGLLNRALNAYATAAADPHVGELAPEAAIRVRIGIGSGDEVAAGRFTLARDVDVRAPASRRTRREQELRPQERVAAVLGRRERVDACETLMLRARADLDAGRLREAALQLRVGLEALLVELQGALVDPGHAEDMATLSARRSEAGEAANAALRGDLDADVEADVRELVETCERVLRRRRVLRG
ncbi:MAG TPA: hypothetical protein VGF09_09395 [Solirubrobacterales bacterium]